MGVGRVGEVGASPASVTVTPMSTFYLILFQGREREEREGGRGSEARDLDLGGMGQNRDRATDVVVRPADAYRRQYNPSCISKEPPRRK